MRWGDLNEGLRGKPDNHEVRFSVDGVPVHALDPVIIRRDGYTEVAWVTPVVTNEPAADAPANPDAEAPAAAIEGDSTDKPKKARKNG